MSPVVLVSGGTGTLGRLVVQRLPAAGATARVLSRRGRRDFDPAAAQWVTGDLDTGAGLAEALDGADAVVHCASDNRRWARDEPAAERLLAAVPATRSPHLVYISIVGVDALPIPYYRVKHRVERLVASSGLPWTVLRTTQFHDLVATGLGALARAYLAARGPRRRVVELPVPGFVLPSMRRGAHLTPEHADGTVTFEDFLARSG